MWSCPTLFRCEEKILCNVHIVETFPLWHLVVFWIAIFRLANDINVMNNLAMECTSGEPLLEILRKPIPKFDFCSAAMQHAYWKRDWFLSVILLCFWRNCSHLCTVHMIMPLCQKLPLLYIASLLPIYCICLVTTLSTDDASLEQDYIFVCCKTFLNFKVDWKPSNCIPLLSERVDLQRFLLKPKNIFCCKFCWAVSRQRSAFFSPSWK